ncbi:hypothetical protein TSAR_006472 [Trichomalopsis sarcophagae]|uniref:Uncharacterized protein n=1 Tax=Trichomalopsis sarcophagae TaxID=543379 RepID=A0A232EMI3_9HYME|nr:hypothetical protein TSAR_006472 [Trichomalopsis sarcophagae]
MFQILTKLQGDDINTVYPGHQVERLRKTAAALESRASVGSCFCFGGEAFGQVLCGWADYTNALG